MSAKFSFAGWNWQTWLVKQKVYVKTIVAGLCTYVSLIHSPFTDPNLTLAFSAAVAIGTRLLGDLVDYWLSEQPPPANVQNATPQPPAA